MNKRSINKAIVVGRVGQDPQAINKIIERSKEE